VLRRILVSVLAGLSLSVVPSASFADGGPLLSINDISVQEPFSFGGVTPAVFTVSLDRPASEVVIVKLMIPPTMEAPAWDMNLNAEVRFAPGDLEQEYTFNVRRDGRYTENSVLPVDLMFPIGAEIADGHGIASIQNVDRAGTFGCGAAVERHYVPGAGWTEEAATPAGQCGDNSAGGNGFDYAWTYLTDGDGTTILPAVGDGAHAEAKSNRQETGLLGVYPSLAGTESSADVRCTSVGGMPELVGNSSVGSLSLLGQRLTPSATYQRIEVPGGGSVELNREVRDSPAPGVHRLIRQGIVVTLASGEQRIYAESVASYVGNPCLV
jgi:hypothetical protein